MRIFPQDLGIKWHAAVLQARTQTPVMQFRDAVTGASPERDLPPPRRGFWGRIWSRGLGMDPTREAQVLPAVFTDSPAGLYAGSTVVGLVLAFLGVPFFRMNDIYLGAPGFLMLWAILSAAGIALVPWANLRALHRKHLAGAEIKKMRESARDEQERAYLTLVLDAIKEPVTRETEASVRAAIQAIGTALERLPMPGVIAEDAEELRRQSGALQEEARRETDEVVAGSQERQAEAVRRLAEIAEHSATVTRRAAALRSELTAQMRALHASLTLPADSGAADDPLRLMRLADSVRRVATEAASVAAARAELGGIASTSTAAVTPPDRDEETLPLRIGR